jgi:hypothetical protein
MQTRVTSRPQTQTKIFAADLQRRPVVGPLAHRARLIWRDLPLDGRNLSAVDNLVSFRTDQDVANRDLDEIDVHT